MADLTVIAILTYLHIASAMGWMGSLAYFLSVLGPSLRTFTPASSLEFLAKAGPRQIRFYAGVTTATLVFGLGLLFATFGTDYKAWPGYVEVGFTLGLMAYLVAVFVTIPAFRKADAIAQQMITNPPGGPPPADLARYLKRGNMAAIAIAILLVLTLAFMVSSAVFV